MNSPKTQNSNSNLDGWRKSVVPTQTKRPVSGTQTNKTLGVKTALRAGVAC